MKVLDCWSYAIKSLIAVDMVEKERCIYSHSTSTMILLLTDGGTLLVAIQRYAPISVRLILVRFSCSPSYTFTGNTRRVTSQVIAIIKLVSYIIFYTRNVFSGSLDLCEPINIHDPEDISPFKTGKKRNDSCNDQFWKVPLIN